MSRSPLKVVLDTNALIRCVSKRSSFSKVLDGLFNGDYELYLTNEILWNMKKKSQTFFRARRQN